VATWCGKATEIVQSFQQPTTFQPVCCANRIVQNDSFPECSCHQKDWPPRFILNATSILSPAIHNRLKEELFRAYITELLIICQERQEVISKIYNLKCDLHLNGYPLKLTDSVINKFVGKSTGNWENAPWFSGISEKFKLYNIRTVFRISPFRVQLWEPDQREVPTGQHIASAVSPTSVADASLAKQVDR